MISKAQLKITGIELVDITFHPDLESFRGKIKTTNWKYHMDMWRELEEDFETKRKYDTIEVEVKFTLFIPGTAEPLVSVYVITHYETKRLTVADVDQDLYIYLYETAIEHAAGWLALQSEGTTLENTLIAHLDHQEYDKLYAKGLQDIWK